MITTQDIKKLLTDNTFRDEFEIEEYLFHMCNEWETYEDMMKDVYENPTWHMPNGL